MRSSRPAPARVRTTRAAAFAVVLAAVAGGVAPASPATAAAPPTVLARATDASPEGRLSTTTYGLAPAEAGTRSTATIRPGWTVQLAVPAGTQQIGLTWAGDPQAQFAIRSATSDGPWSVALPLEGEVAEAADASRTRPGAGPIWLGAPGVQRVEVRLLAGLVHDVRLTAMAFQAETSGTRAATVRITNPATPAGGPPIRVRSSWAPAGWNTAGDGCGSGPTLNSQLRAAIVHHTVGSNAYAQGDVPGILAGIYRFHTQDRGWCDVGYNLFVDRFGGVWEGRLGGLDLAVQGGHAMGFNSTSVGVSLMGQFEPGEAPAAASPSAAMLQSLRGVLAWKLGAQGLDPQGRVMLASAGNPRFASGTVVDLPVISGHRDTAFTSCPGELAYARLPQLRADVASTIAATNDPTRWAPHPTGARYFGAMLKDAEGASHVQARVGSSTSLVVRAGYPQDLVAGSIVLSPTTDRRIGVVDRLLRVAYGRPADTTGLRTHITARDQGVGAEALARRMLDSPELVSRYRHLRNRSFADALLRQAGRVPTSAELDAWTGHLNGGMRREVVLLFIAESAEHRARVARQTKVATAWFALLRRAPTTAETSDWVARLGQGTTDGALVTALARSDEYRRRFP